MTTLHIPYGKTSLEVNIADHHRVEHIVPAQVTAVDDARAAVEHALDHPEGGVSIADFAGAESAVIAINDKTRPVPHADLLPPLLAQIEALGIPPERITLLIATGTHPVMPPEEYTWILPQAIIDRYPIICHDYNDDDVFLHLGETERGTPVTINRHYMAADLRVVVGNVEPHQFMGFSGGVKSAVIGLAGRPTINHNHGMMVQPEATLGRYDDNPMRQDVEEMGRIVRVDFALNALLNSQKQIVKAIAGDPRAVMAAAIPQVRELYTVQVATPYDLMIVSPGGNPKDINVYQSQKALGHATRVAKPGGVVFLCAACPEGAGSQTYEDWVAQQTSYDDVFEQFAAEGFRVGPHKAYQIARDASKLHVHWKTEMPPNYARKLLLEPVNDLQSALDDALNALPDDAHIGVMTLANATIPALTD